jgi:exodeoxyribonuclease III
VRLLTLNIRQGGGTRRKVLVEAILAHEPDVVVLTEFRSNAAGDAIRDALDEAGLSHQFTPPGTEPKVNTLLVAGRSPLDSRYFPDLGDDQHRVVVAESEDLRVIGVYFAQGKAKRKVFDFLLEQTPSLLPGRSIVLGDFNTGRHYEDEPKATLHCADCFDALLERGWVDAWRSRHPDAREFSWYSNVGNGFRIDHALVSLALYADIADVQYSHRERLEKWTDHSVLIVDVADRGESAAS